MQCKFQDGWAGQCKNDAEESGFCEKHKDVKCSSCGEHATHSCSETMGPLVCGEPLCDNCEHTIYSDGTNGGLGSIGHLPEGYKDHCKKTDQKYETWYRTEWKKAVKNMAFTYTSESECLIKIGYSIYVAKIDKGGDLTIFDNENKVVNDICGNDIKNELFRRI
jgi:hypothetical protein